jgi:hypothetical protein
MADQGWNKEGKKDAQKDSLKDALKKGVDNIKEEARKVPTPPGQKK